MNLITLTAGDFIGENKVQLQDRRFQHIQQILKPSVGDTLRVGQIDGNLGYGIITSLSQQSVELDISLTELPPAKLPLTIVLSLPRPKMMRRLFRSVAEIGVEHLIVINSYKVEKSYWQSPALNSETIREYLIEGLQQARDTVIPTLTFKRLFKPFVEDELPALARGRKALIAHPETGTRCPLAIDEPAVLAIGPEGGFTPYEVDKFIETGFSAIHLGPRILRVENALTALVSKLYR